MDTRISKTLWSVCFIISLLFICSCSKKVTINTDPSGAKLLINNEEGGISPLTIKLKFKDQDDIFKVIAQKEDYQETYIDITYQPTSQTDYNIFLKKNAKTVRIITEPPGAKIYIDGQESGISPLTKKLSFKDAKQYDIIARLDKYEDGKTTILLEPQMQSDYLIPPLKKIEIVSVENIVYKPQQTEKGVSLLPVQIPTLAYLEVIERSPMVKSVTRITNNEDPNLKILDPVLSPRSDILVYGEFTQEPDVNYCNIWKTTVGSFGKTRVTYGKWSDLFPAFTPDGEYLIFSSNRTRANSTLWRIRVDGGGGVTNITSTLALDYSPSVSPDDNLIIYESRPPNAEEPQIWSINTNGTLPTQLREGLSPRISPDGQKIMFVRIDKLTKKKQIWVMGLNGSEETQITQNNEYDAEHPVWSPDGKWIVFDANEGLDSQKRQNYDIWLMAADGSKKTQLTTNGSWDDSPCWDYAGKFIYFRSNRGGAWNIWRFEPILPK